MNQEQVKVPIHEAHDPVFMADLIWFRHENVSQTAHHPCRTVSKADVSQQWE